jgi:lysophospholipase L1-like esterase
VNSADHPLLGKTGRALLAMVVTLALPYASPRLRSLRLVESPWDRGSGAQTDDDAPPLAATIPPPPASGEQELPASDNLPTINNALPRDLHDLPDIADEVRARLRVMPIEDPTGHALDAFFERLRQTDHGVAGALTRILHYGDSTIASDYVSGTVRRRLQARFGDGGHGFILIANPWQWYFHNDVVHGSDGDWTASRLAGPIAADGMYGPGGVSFTSYGGGRAWFGTPAAGDYGRHVSRFDLYYLEQPGGGDVELVAGGAPAERLATRGMTKVGRVHSVRVRDGEATLHIRALGGGPVRLFGVALERDGPGVVYDALGAHAAMAVYWQRQDRNHWQAEMDLRDPALVIFQYGTNESDLWRLDQNQYEQGLTALIDEIREIAPHASLLVASPLDRAEAKHGRLLTRQVILDLVAIQRRVSLAHGAAFWSTFDAMGGAGSMALWARTHPRLAGPDLTHPTPAGAEVLGDMLADALIAGYERFAHPPRTPSPPSP